MPHRRRDDLADERFENAACGEVIASERRERATLTREYIGSRLFGDPRGAAELCECGGGIGDACA